MATSNFYAKNAQSIYALLDTIEYEYNGEKIEEVRDQWDFEDLLDSIRERGTEGNFPNEMDIFNRDMDMAELCETDDIWEVFGNGNAHTTDTMLCSTIGVRNGYYSGANLDYQIKVKTTDGDEFLLSDYDDVDDLVNDYMDCLEDIIKWRGHQHKWNMGTFYLMEKNIRKWITKRINDEIEKCETFCKSVCDCELSVFGRFSNGETLYTKVG